MWKLVYSSFTVFQRLTSSNRRDQSSEIIPVCDLTFHEKLALCKAILDQSYFGFTFQDGILDYDCQLETISFKQHCSESWINCWGWMSKPPERDLFRCPRLQYNDLESDKTIVVPLEHYISGSSNLPRSYFSYIEENDEIFAQKFAYNVNVEQISTLLRDSYKYKTSQNVYRYDFRVRLSLFVAIKKIKESGKSKFFSWNNFKISGLS